jgi:hypothetical protein
MLLESRWRGFISREKKAWRCNMRGVQDWRLQADRFAELARGAKSPEDRERFLRLKRSYVLIARSAEFDKSLGDLITRLSAKPRSQNHINC